MGIRDSLDRLKSTRVGRTSKHDSAEKEEMENKYHKGRKFHHKHNADKPKSQSIRDKLVKKALAKGKELQEKSKQHAIDELKKKKSKSKKIKTKQKSEPREKYSGFSFGFENHNNEGFGFGMFTPEKQQGKPKQEEVDWSKVFNFRMDSESKKRHYDRFGGF
jgi:hypothetical protein